MKNEEYCLITAKIIHILLTAIKNIKFKAAIAITSFNSMVVLFKYMKLIKLFSINSNPLTYSFKNV